MLMVSLKEWVCWKNFLDEVLIFMLISSVGENINTESLLLSLNLTKSDLPVQVNATKWNKTLYFRSCYIYFHFHC